MKEIFKVMTEELVKSYKKTKIIQRIYNIIVIIPFSFGLITILLLYVEYSKNGQFWQIFFYYRKPYGLLLLFFILVPIFLMIMRYLQSGKIFYSNQKGSLIQTTTENVDQLLKSQIALQEDKIQILNKTIFELKQSIQSSSTISDHDKKELTDSLKKNTVVNLTFSNQDEIEIRGKRYGKQISIATHVEQGYNQMNNRLNDQIKALGWRANLNLLIGIIITTIGLGTLVYYVSRIPNELNNSFGIFAYFIPRLSLAVLIEIFA